MAFSGGVFSKLYSWATEQATPPIEIAKLDAQETDFATGLSNCILRDGTGVPTAATPWNSQRISSLGTATARTDAITTAQVQDFSICKIGSVSGTDTITGSLTPAISAYVSGMLVTFVPAATNTGAATININTVGAVDILKYDGEALGAGDIVIGVPCVLVMDGGADDFILLNPQSQVTTRPNASASEFGYIGIPQNSQTGNYTLVLSDAGKQVFHPSAGVTGTYTIPANGSVAYPVGTTLSFINGNASSFSIAITTDTMTLAGTSTTGTRTLASNGIATAVKITSTSWLISGTGLS